MHIPVDNFAIYGAENTYILVDLIVVCNNAMGTMGIRILLKKKLINLNIFSFNGRCSYFI